MCLDERGEIDLLKGISLDLEPLDNGSATNQLLVRYHCFLGFDLLVLCQVLGC